MGRIHATLIYVARTSSYTVVPRHTVDLDLPGTWEISLFSNMSDRGGTVAYAYITKDHIFYFGT